jgi:hypothetical protein
MYSWFGFCDVCRTELAENGHCNAGNYSTKSCYCPKCHKQFEYDTRRDPCWKPNPPLSSEDEVPPKRYLSEREKDLLKEIFEVISKEKEKHRSIIEWKSDGESEDTPLTQTATDALWGVEECELALKREFGLVDK